MFARTERLNSMRITTEIRSATECFVTMAQASIPNFVEKYSSLSFLPITFGRCVWFSVSLVWVCALCRAFVPAIRNEQATHIMADRRRPICGIVFTFTRARRVRVRSKKKYYWMKALRPYLTHEKNEQKPHNFSDRLVVNFLCGCLAKTQQK